MMSKTLTLTVLVLLMAACSETVDTRLQIDFPYSIYGIMNPKSDTHAVRVFEITQNIAVIDSDPIDATVMTTQLSNGEIRTWRDTVIQLDNDVYRHVYWSVFDASMGETYHLNVTRSDGVQSEAMTTIPPPIIVEVLEPDTFLVRQAIMPLKITGTPPNLPRIDVEYILVGFDENGANPVFKPVTINYAGLQTPESDGFLLNIDLAKDYLEIYQLFDEDNDVTPNIIDLREIFVTIHVGDSQWVSPIGLFNNDFLVEPGSFSNVENGFGFFGSGYSETISFRPPLVLIQRAGFQIP
ncbi:MAG: hypothetical protein OXE59_05220 [Bacteroidetes bacterium]|nr:hypothetical protein [Bacteroidota bacterium]